MRVWLKYKNSKVVTVLIALKIVVGNKLAGYFDKLS